MKNFKIYSLSNFPLYGVFNYSHQAVNYIPRATQFITGSLGGDPKVQTVSLIFIFFCA